MSLLFSDSLLGIIDENTLAESDAAVGTITFKGNQKEIDAFIFDKRSVRVHVIANLDEVFELADSVSVEDAIISIGGSRSFTGKIHQIGWEQTLNGGRIVIGIIIRDK